MHLLAIRIVKGVRNTQACIASNQYYNYLIKLTSVTLVFNYITNHRIHRIH